MLERTSWMLPRDSALALTAGPGATAVASCTAFNHRDSRRSHKGPHSTEKKPRVGEPSAAMSQASGLPWHSQRWGWRASGLLVAEIGDSFLTDPLLGPPPFDSPLLFSFLLTSSRKESKHCQNMAAEPQVSREQRAFSVSPLVQEGARGSCPSS